MSILIENVLLNGQKKNIFIEENIIKYIGTEKKQSDTIISGTDKVALPTLVNGHTHAAMTLLRGYGDDLPLHTWLQEKIWPIEAKLTKEDIYWGAKLACLEMIRTGTTLFNDMYWHIEEVAKAVEEMGVRGVLAAPLLDFHDPEKARQEQAHLETFFEEVPKRYSSRIQFALGPHAIYTVSSENLRWVAEFGTKNNLMQHIHISETEKEVLDCLKLHKKRPVEYLQELGFLNSRVISAHSVWLDEKELDLFQEYDVAAVHNPCANMKLAVGNVFPYPKIEKRGIRFCIGTDGCSSNNNLDMFEELKFAALMQKWHNNDPTMLPCQRLWNVATQKAHEIFQVNAGILKEGKLADLMLVDLRQPQMTPRHDLISNLVYSISGNLIDTVICDGKILMQGQRIKGEEEILARSNEIAVRLTSA